MSESDRRKDVATAGVGYTGVAAGGALRETGIHRAHRLEGRDPRTERRKIPSRSLLKAPQSRGRGKARALYLGGSALGLSAAPAAAVGTHRLLHPNDRDEREARPTKTRAVKRDSSREFWREGVEGAEQALRERARSSERSPAKAQATAAGLTAAAGALGGQATHTGLNRVSRRMRVPARARAALTAVGAVGGASAALPATSRVSRSTTGYEMTPTGVRRPKTAPKRPSRSATTVEAREKASGYQGRRRTREQIVGKADSPIPDYPGRDVSRGKKRAAVYAAGASGPIVGDIAAAGTAARLAPPHQRRSAAAYQFGGSQGGQVVGAGLGAYGLARAAAAKPGGRVDRASQSADAKIKGAKAQARRAAGLGEGPTKLGTAVSGAKQRAGQRTAAKMPKTAQRAGRHFGRVVARKPAAAAIGGLIGSSAGGQTGGYLGYGRALDNEQKWKAQVLNQARRETASKAEAGKPLTRREKAEMSRKKRTQAAISTFTGMTGMGALAATGGSKVKRVPLRWRHRLERVQTPLLTAGAGVGGAGALNFAGIQRREAQAEAPKQKTSKALRPRRRRKVLQQVDAYLQRSDTAATRGQRRLEQVGPGQLAEGPVGKRALIPTKRPAGVGRRKTYRSSGIRMSRDAAGGMRPTRIRAGVG